MNKITQLITNSDQKGEKHLIKYLQKIATENDCYFEVKFEEGETGECFILHNDKTSSGGIGDIWGHSWYIVPSQKPDDNYTVLFEHIGKDNSAERLKIELDRLAIIIEKIRFREVDPKTIRITSQDNIIQLP